MPITLEKGEQLAHTYTVEMTRAVFDNDCFEVFAKYEERVHKKFASNPGSYEGCWCESPLYDPRDP